MLGIGFGEMVLIAGVALVVIGPEKFPDFAKLVIRTVGDLRGYVDEVKSEVTRELKPLKKEMESLKRIDPEKYIDSLTSGDDLADKPDKVPSDSVNPSINEEDRKVMAVDDVENYNDDPYGWEASDDGGYGVDKGAYPEETVGYGDHSTDSEAGEADDVVEEAPSESTSELADDAQPSNDDGEATDTPAGVSEESSEFDGAEDNRTEFSNPEEPDVWTGR